jgi:hypothetical protein
MPPRRSERVAAVVERATSALSPLPPALVQQIFLLLAVDERARCACVCRSWRAAVSERCLWTRLDVSRTSGFAAARVTDAFLRGAVARAAGELQSLDVSGALRVSREALLAVATANAGTLRELRACHGVCLGADLAVPNPLSLPNAETLLRAAPQVRVLEADVICGNVADARRALRADEGLLAPLRVHGLRLLCGDAAEADMVALAADMAAHAWLQELCLLGVLPAPAVLDAAVSALLSCRPCARVQFMVCNFNPASAPALARLLAGSAVTNLSVVGEGGGGVALLDVPSAMLLAGALRANTTLTSLQVAAVNMWQDAEAAATLLGALTAHASLRTLILSHNIAREDAQRAAACATLGALLAANAPALTDLNVRLCNLSGAGIAPLCAALPANTHLRTLNCEGNILTPQFAADVLLPAVRANASLRALITGRQWPAEREAEAVVARRAAAAGDER